VSEQALRELVCAALYRYAAFPCENSALPGTPDVLWIGGCCELKEIDDWPARASTTVKLKRYTDRQRHFLKKWRRHGGNAWLLVRVASTQEYLLYNQPHQFEALANVTKAIMQQLATHRLHHHSQIKEKLRECLTRNDVCINTTMDGSHTVKA
jgi:hypothetical protein